MSLDRPSRAQFAKTIDKLLEDQFGVAKAGGLKESMHFVDFLRDGKEDPETGEELPPLRIYEPVAGLQECRERVAMFCGRFNEAYAEMLFSTFDARGEGALDYTQAQQALQWLMRTPADGGAKLEVPLACPAEAYDAAGGLRLERPWFFMLYRTMP